MGQMNKLLVKCETATTCGLFYSLIVHIVLCAFSFIQYSLSIYMAIMG